MKVLKSLLLRVSVFSVLVIVADNGLALQAGGMRKNMERIE